MKVAITGAAGYIGRRVVTEALARGLAVVAIDKDLSAAYPTPPRLLPSYGDTGDFQALVRAFGGMDAVIHLAVRPRGSDREAQLHNENVVGSFNVLQAAHECGIRRVCMASSIGAIGIDNGLPLRLAYFPVDEQHPAFCADAYGLSKRIGEVQAAAMARLHPEMTIASLRFLWVTEDRETPRRALRRLVRGTGNLWGYTPVALAAHACLVSLQAGFTGHEVINVGAPDTAVDVPTLQLARQFFPHVPLRRNLPGTASFFDGSKAARLLGLP